MVLCKGGHNWIGEFTFSWLRMMFGDKRTTPRIYCPAASWQLDSFFLQEEHINANGHAYVQFGRICHDCQLCWPKHSFLKSLAQNVTCGSVVGCTPCIPLSSMLLFCIKLSCEAVEKFSHKSGHKCLSPIACCHNCCFVRGCGSTAVLAL